MAHWVTRPSRHHNPVLHEEFYLDELNRPRLEGEATVIVSVPSATMQAHEQQVEQWKLDIEQWKKDVEKWEKDMVRYNKEWRGWNKLENKALGSLRATTTTAIQTVLEHDITARGAWDAIQQRFGQHNAASACEHAIQERALPELTFTVAREIVINHYKARKPAPLATRIPSVKMKDKDPKFQQQTSSSSSSSNNTSNNSSNNDKKKKNQCHGRKNKGNNQDNKGGSNQGHSHIASFAHLGISSPPIIPESPSVTHPAVHNRGPLHMQCYSGATTCGTVYENAQSARSLADHLGLPKYAHILEPMEQGYAAASSSKRGLNGPSSSALLNKHSKSVEVEEVHDLHDPFYDGSDSE
ncbi:hypothetical protein PQX77_018284 [Marasmius sp. AFHP31]|nr:hypothetical protein PQX77_018284 [Marasmius sp. AFHP31]